LQRYIIFLYVRKITNNIFLRGALFRVTPALLPTVAAMASCDISREDDCRSM
jgi:hypothetical protein